MNAAQVLIRTLVGCGVDTCFMNPGTSEINFVAALDVIPEMHGVLCLFEGVATGAADGHARMTSKAASTLLHLGPGLGNGLANLHNARRARSPIVNLVGDHATYHKLHDTLLESDIDTVARNVSRWVRRSAQPDEVGRDVAEAVAAATAPPAGIATLIVPADVAWLEGGEPAAPPLEPQLAPVSDDVIEKTASALRSGKPCVVLLGGRSLREPGLVTASRVASATGAELLCETFPARLERGGGLPAIERLAYLAESASAQLGGVRHLVTVDARVPVSFFAYPGKPSSLVPDGCETHVLASGADDAVEALGNLADLIGAPRSVPGERLKRPERPKGELTSETAALGVGALLPEGAIVSDEANTMVRWMSAATAGAARHDWLTLTGGAIGDGLPVATGASIACPDRKVVCLEADGSAMYTFQALWTQARESLDVTTVLLNNRSYAILNLELRRLGAGPPGPKGLGMLDLSRPDLDFVSLARGMGVQASRAETAEEFTIQLENALAEPGPHLIEAMVRGRP